MSSSSSTPVGGVARARRPRWALLTCCLAVTLTVAGCAAPMAAPEASSEPRPELAQSAEVLAGSQQAVTSATGGDSGPTGARADESEVDPGGGSGGGTSDGDQSGGPDGASDASPTRSRSWSAVTRLDDPLGDHGAGPTYADLTGLLVDESGDLVRLTVNLSGVIPGRLADREVQGVGIDVFHGRGTESDQQVFLDGGTHGWRAFLQTPRGFVPFPGSFTVTGRSLVVVLPWSSLGGRDGARTSVFADWSNGSGRTASDVAPNGNLLPLS